ncbi:MAG: toll/interleukin-1 receptor domain-containing protein [Flavobacteriales bacterium]|nr:toll/interleukin-1 receptor domain-containing protein [Flavobacteriales bacterium]
MSKKIFISYSHTDNETHLWLERLKGFLDAVQDQLPFRIWEDTMIPNGGDWRKSINDALSESAVAILLVGQGFLASRFIKEKELPEVLPAKDKNRVRLYILYVGFCPWQYSVLEPYEAFNDPDKPLESLTDPMQNQWLNNLVVTIRKDLENIEVLEAIPNSTIDLIEPMQNLKDHLEVTKTTLITILNRSQNLLRSVQRRLEIDEHLQYEQFFLRYYDLMNEEEHFQFDQIRALTEGVMFGENNSILQIIEQNRTLRDELPIIGALKTHLIIWLNKYKLVFSKNKKMAVCFTGVEDGVPFPLGVDEQVENWLKIHRE